MATTKRLSLCMILNNEEVFIENCLRSASRLADEIVIVDTGSTDGTKEICQTFDAKIYDFPWNGSFADARNFGIERATGDWILWLDADEELEAADAQAWREALEDETQQVWGLPVINYYGEFPPDPNQAYLLAQCRVFRHGRGIRFVNAIHEQLHIQPRSGESGYSAEDKLLPAVIHHYGYLEPIVTAKRKHERNVAMLQKEKDSPDYSPWVDYHMASEHYRAQAFPEAFEQLNVAIRRFIEKGQLPPSLIYKMKYDTLLALGSYSGAWAGIGKAIELYPDYVDLHYYKGVILFAKERYEEAEAALKHCLTLGETHLRHLTMKGMGSFHALYLIGRCREATGDADGAAEAYIDALRQCPNHKEAKQRLAQLTLEHPEYKELAER